MREFHCLDGPAAEGKAGIQGCSIPFPGVLLSGWTRPVGVGPEGFAGRIEPLSNLRPLWRRLRLEFPEGQWDLEFPVPTPEIRSAPEDPLEVAPGIWWIRWPLPLPAPQRLREHPGDLWIWSNARALLRAPEDFVRAAVEIREMAGPDPLLWAPRVATPGRLALLHWLGIDLLDTIEGFWRATEGEWIFSEMEQIPNRERDEEALCSCSYCASGEDTLENRIGHAAGEYLREERKVRAFLRAQRLREFVEIRAGGEPLRGELLRYADRDHSGHFEALAPLRVHGIHPYGTAEALRRPEASRFRRWFRDRYRPPRARSILLLVPCSKTKPYASSPTHRRLARTIEQTGVADQVHLVSVTSPLGLVPRELENFPPARHYDIPVTGLWNEDERMWVQQALDHLLETGAYSAVVAHLPSGEYRWLRESWGGSSPPVYWTVEDERPVSSESLAALGHRLKALAEAAPPIRGGRLSVIREDLRASASMQFGPAVAEALFAGSVWIRGRPWFRHLDGPGRGELASWREDNGLWHLTLAGANYLGAVTAPFQVTVVPGLTLRGDLFAPGARAAGPDIVAGSEVVLVSEGQLVGVGESQIPSSWFGRLSRGLVVKVRHRSHNPVPLASATGRDTVANDLSSSAQEDL